MLLLVRDERTSAQLQDVLAFGGDTVMDLRQAGDLLGTLCHSNNL